MGITEFVVEDDGLEDHAPEVSVTISATNLVQLGDSTAKTNGTKAEAKTNQTQQKKENLWQTMDQMQTMTKNVINKVTPKVVVNDTKVKEEAKKAEKKAIQEARNELLK